MRGHTGRQSVKWIRNGYWLPLLKGPRYTCEAQVQQMFTEFLSILPSFAELHVILIRGIFGLGHLRFSHLHMAVFNTEWFKSHAFSIRVFTLTSVSLPLFQSNVPWIRTIHIVRGSRHMLIGQLWSRQLYITRYGAGNKTLPERSVALILLQKACCVSYNVIYINIVSSRDVFLWW